MSTPQQHGRGDHDYDSRSLALADDLERQMAHWQTAARSFLDAEAFPSRAAWESLEHTTGLPIRSQLARTVDELIRSERAATNVVRGSRTNPAGLPAPSGPCSGSAGCTCRWRRPWTSSARP